MKRKFLFFASCFVLSLSIQVLAQTRIHVTDNFDTTNGVAIKISEAELLGKKPIQMRNGKIQIIVNWLQNNLNDPSTMKILGWSQIEKETVDEQPFWGVRVKLRAKNAFGAYILSNFTFYIRRNKVVRVLS